MFLQLIQSKRTMMVCLGVIITLMLCRETVAQDTPPEIGKPMPSYTLTDIHYFSKKQASLHDFSGKWLFLDFWSPMCSNSTSSFRRLDAFRKQFANQTTWMMVGCNSRMLKYEPAIQVSYERFRKAYNHNLPIAFDSVLVFKWNIPFFPVIYIVDPAGTLRYITDGSDLTAEKIVRLIRNEPVSLYDVTKLEARKEFDPDNVKLSDPAVYSTVLHRSMLLRWNGEQPDGGMPVDRWLTAGRKFQDRGYTFAGVPLYWLFNHAYLGRTYWGFDDPDYGRVYPMPVVETADSTWFDFNLSSTARPGTYTYTLHVPASGLDRTRIMTTMQHDLAAAFGLRGKVERRHMPVWKVVAAPGAIEKLKTKGGAQFVSPGNHVLGFTVRNVPPQYLIGEIALFLLGKYLDPYVPFVDETGLQHNFDLTLEAEMDNLADVQRALRKHGLDIVKGTREMEVLVIK